MLLLKEKILQLGTVPREGVLKVDRFLNHIIDPRLMMEIGRELSFKFKDQKIDKVLTLESSGIAPALGTALELGVPLLFAKKSLPSTMHDAYTAQVFSFTKNKTSDIFVSKEYITAGENILIVDDFLAMGNAVLGMKQIIEEGGAHCAGVGIVIEKSFQDGRKILEEHGLRVESLARLKSISKDKIEFL